MSDPTMPELASFLADAQMTREAGGSIADVVARHPALAELMRPAPVAAVPQIVVQAPAPVAQRRPMAPYIAAGAGAVAAVLVVGTVLTALLLAVAITAASLTITALVIKSLMNSHHNQH